MPVQALDEIQAGIFDGWTYDQIAEKHPDEYAARKRDKLRYRFLFAAHCAPPAQMLCTWSKINSGCLVRLTCAAGR